MRILETRAIRTVLSSEFKDSFDADTKTPRTHNADHGGIIEIIFFQPNQTNDRPKEPHGSAAKGISVSGK